MSLLCFVICAMSDKIIAKNEPVIGDRLIVAINNHPYTQRQVESYIAIKESLRERQESVALVTEANWREALAVFNEDMMILQESQRLGSLQITEQMHKKYRDRVKEILKKDKDFRVTMQRLGLAEAEIIKTLENALRVETFRRSKDKQAEVSNLNIGETTNGKVSWLANLEERSVIRLFKGADAYLEIQPVQGEPGHAR